MEHDFIVITSTGRVDTDYMPRKIKNLIQKALRELKEKQSRLPLEDEEGIGIK